MKLLAIVLLLIAPIQDVQKEVESAVKKYIVNNLDDPKGFEVVQFGKIQKFMTEYSMTEMGKSELDIAKEFLKYAKEAMEKSKLTKDKIEADFQLKEVETNRQGSVKFMQLYTEHAADFTSVQYGWKIFCKYRSKGLTDKLFLNQDTFYLDKKMNVVSKDTIILTDLIR